MGPVLGTRDHLYPNLTSKLDRVYFQGVPAALLASCTSNRTVAASFGDGARSLSRSREDRVLLSRNLGHVGYADQEAKGFRLRGCSVAIPARFNRALGIRPISTRQVASLYRGGHASKHALTRSERTCH